MVLDFKSDYAVIKLKLSKEAYETLSIKQTESTLVRHLWTEMFAQSITVSTLRGMRCDDLFVIKITNAKYLDDLLKDFWIYDYKVIKRSGVVIDKITGEYLGDYSDVINADEQGFTLLGQTYKYNDFKEIPHMYNFMSAMREWPKYKELRRALNSIIKEEFRDYRYL